MFAVSLQMYVSADLQQTVQKSSAIPVKCVTIESPCPYMAEATAVPSPQFVNTVLESHKPPPDVSYVRLPSTSHLIIPRSH